MICSPNIDLFDVALQTIFPDSIDNCPTPSPNKPSLESSSLSHYSALRDWVGVIPSYICLYSMCIMCAPQNGFAAY